MKNVTKGDDISLVIYTPVSEGWPRVTLTKRNLLKGIEERKYKFTYTNEMVDEEEIKNMISTNSIDLTHCFDTLEDGIFRKLRSGLIKEKNATQPGKAKKNQ